LHDHRSTVLVEYQHDLLDWVASQPGLTGAVILAAGLLSAFYGVRMLRVLLALYCGAVGYVLGIMFAPEAGLPPIVAPGAALMGVTAALAWPGPATILASGATWAAAGAYFADEMALPDYFVGTASALACGIATIMTVLCRRTMIILLTSLQGAAMIIVGVIGVAATVLPSVSTTFRAWSSGRSLTEPMLLGMLMATAYSCQANFCQGDIVTGSQAEAEPLPKTSRPAPSRKFS
jgi:hypothetical protein